MAAPAPHRRARTEQEKFERRRAILDAASQHFADVGFEAFSVAKLARLAGVAKGTLYLYFTTREEVFLALHSQQLEAFASGLVARLEPDMSDEGFTSAFYHAAVDVPGFLDLFARLDHVIEHNVSVDALVASKRTAIALVDEVAGHVARALALPPDLAFDILRSFATLLNGAARFDQGPTLEGESLPDDVRGFIDAFNAETTFTTNARRILAGIRIEHRRRS